MVSSIKPLGTDNSDVINVFQNIENDIELSNVFRTLTLKSDKDRPRKKITDKFHLWVMNMDKEILNNMLVRSDINIYTDWRWKHTLSLPFCYDGILISFITNWKKLKQSSCCFSWKRKSSSGCWKLRQWEYWIINACHLAVFQRQIYSRSIYRDTTTDLIFSACKCSEVPRETWK